MYTCKATNNLGEAVTFTTVNATGRSELDLGTKHPKGVEGFRAIASFEAKGALEDQPGVNVIKRFFFVTDKESKGQSYKTYLPTYLE